MSVENLDFAILSPRESEILALAVDGLTDDHIARQLDIRRSTVNSYWVRIRGKLGQKTRTELVARFLRNEAEATEAKLLQRIRELEIQLAQLDRSYAASQDGLLESECP